MWGRTFEFLSVLFLIEQTNYYKVVPKLNENKEDIFNLYETLGEIEALISVLSYKVGLNNKYTTSVFCKDIILNIDKRNNRKFLCYSKKVR